METIYPQSSQHHRLLVIAVSLSILIHGVILWSLSYAAQSAFAGGERLQVLNVLLVRRPATQSTVRDDVLPAGVSTGRKVAAAARPPVDHPQPVPPEKTVPAVNRITAPKEAVQSVSTPSPAPRLPNSKPSSNALSLRFAPRAVPSNKAAASPVVPKGVAVTRKTYESPAARATTSRLADHPAQPEIALITAIHAPVPEYPRKARRLGLQGTVWLHILLTKSGIPDRIEIMNSSGYSILDRSAADAVHAWRFRVPAVTRSSGSPSVDIPVRFQLE